MGRIYSNICLHFFRQGCGVLKDKQPVIYKKRDRKSINHRTHHDLPGDLLYGVDKTLQCSVHQSFRITKALTI